MLSRKESYRYSKELKMDRVYDYRMALHSATGFLNVAVGIFKTVGDTVNEVAVSLSQRPAEIICGATNLNLASELFLKSLLIALNHKAPNTHDLSNLYKRIPEEIRNHFQIHYERNTLINGRKPFFVYLNSYKNEDGDVVTNEKQTKFTIEDVLSRSSNGFILWRYCHELNMDSHGHRSLLIEYDRLIIICKCIKVFIENNDDRFQKELEIWSAKQTR
jgi:hypothetical protein